MNIQLVSTMPYGNEAALRDFLLVHRLVHTQVDAAIAAKGGGALPNATLDSDSAATAWVAIMHGEPISEERQRALTDWMQLHANLHQDEYDRLDLGFAPDLSLSDFSQPRQFYDWMAAHAAVHDTLAAATGVV